MSSTPRIKGLDTVANLFRFVRVNAAGELVIATLGATPIVTDDVEWPLADSGAFATNLVVSATARRWRALNVRSSAAADRFLHIFNAAALPPNGTAPSYCPLRVPPGGQAGYAVPPVLFGTGIVVASSTTEATLTLTGAADMWFSVHHRAPL